MATALTRAIARMLLVPTLVVAAAILVKGYSGPGDGFSAGVVAALGILLQYVALGYREADESLAARLAPMGAVAGLLLVLSIAFAPLLLGEAILTHYPEAGSPAIHLGTLEIVTAVLFDVGVFFIVLGLAVTAIRALAQHAASRS